MINAKDLYETSQKMEEFLEKTYRPYFDVSFNLGDLFSVHTWFKCFEENAKEESEEGRFGCRMFLPYNEKLIDGIRTILAKNGFASDVDEKYMYVSWRKEEQR